MTLESLEIASLLGAGTSTLTVYKIAEDQEWKGVQGTTIAGLATSVTGAVASANSENVKNIDVATQYIESLSDDELYEMELKLSNIDTTLLSEEQEGIKRI